MILSTSLAIAALIGVQGFTPSGTLDFRVFGQVLHLGDLGLFQAVSPESFLYGALAQSISTLVPLVVLFGSLPSNAERAEGMDGRARWNALGQDAFGAGLLSQFLILPALALALRILTPELMGRLLRADLWALFLGLQLLLWARLLRQLLSVNEGLILLLTLGVKALGGLLAWAGEFLPDLGFQNLPALLPKILAWASHILPTVRPVDDPVPFFLRVLSLVSPFVLLLLAEAHMKEDEACSG